MDSTTLLSGTALTSAVSITPTSGASEPGELTAKLSTDSKILIITSTNAYEGTYKISLNKSVLSKTGKCLYSYTETKTLKDTVKPVYKGCTLDNTGLHVSLNFSEPVFINSLVLSDAKYSNGNSLINPLPFLTNTNYTLSGDKKSILIDLTQTVFYDQNISIDLTLSGIVDMANNKLDTEPLVATFSLCPISPQVSDPISPQVSDPISPPIVVSPPTKVLNVYRNGNSIVAEFDKSMKIPGYLEVNGKKLPGVVNINNDTEIIYLLNDSTLSSYMSELSVTLYNYEASDNSSDTSTSTQYTVDFGATATYPSVTNASFTTKMENSILKSVLTLTYNREIVCTNKSGSLTATSTIGGVSSEEVSYTYSATASEKTVTITFSDSIHFTTNAKYTFAIPASFVIDNYYNSNEVQSIDVIKQAGDMVALPSPSDIRYARDLDDYVYIIFDDILDQATAEDKTNYRISGVIIQSAQLIQNSNNTPAIVKLTISSNSILSGIPYEVIISGIKGYKDSYTTMEEYKQMIILSNVKTLECVTATASSFDDTVTLEFLTSLVSSSPTNIDYTATIKETTLKKKSVDLSDKTVTITFDEDLTANQMIVLSPSNYNYLIDTEGKRLLNTMIYVVVR